MLVRTSNVRDLLQLFVSLQGTAGDGGTFHHLRLRLLDAGVFLDDALEFATRGRLPPTWCRC